MKRSMFVITHKSIEDPIGYKDFNYLSVGSNDTNATYSDKQGNNISEKNPYFCELTGLYWIWKNVTAEEVGLCHYRRFFCKKENNLYDLLTVDELSDLLQDGDIIMAKPINFYMDYFTFYEKGKRNNALRKCCEYIVEKDPNYKRAITNLLKKKTNRCYNMFYCKKGLIDEYCDWLFGVLFEYENMIDISGWSKEQQRVYGFIAEFLFNVWVEYHHLKVIQVDVAQSEIFPASLETNACKIQASSIKRIGYRILPSVWPILSHILVEDVKVSSPNKTLMNNNLE